MHITPTKNFFDQKFALVENVLLYMNKFPIILYMIKYIGMYK